MRHRSSRPRSARPGRLEPLDPRLLFAVVASADLPDLSVASGQFPGTVNLNAAFASTTITGTAVALSVAFGSTAGIIDVGLYDAATPKTVASFLSYVNSGAYNGTLFHRSEAGKFILGGGYYFPSGSAVQSAGPIPSEAPQSPRDADGHANTLGTLAAYRIGTNAATSQFLINAGDNSAAYDAGSAPLTTFGRVLGSGMDIVNAINALPTIALAAPFDELPVTGLATGSAPAQSNIVALTSARVVNPISYIADSSAPEIVTPIVNDDGTLSLTYQPEVTGDATLTITATDLDGATLVRTFVVHIRPAANLQIAYGNTPLDPAGAATTNFGRIPVADASATVTRQFTLRNTGSDDLTGITYSFSGSPTPAFSLSGVPDATLVSGESTTITVRIDPTLTGDRRGSLIITAPGSATPLITVPLEADIGRTVTLSAATPAVTLTANGVVATFTLANPGTGTATFSLSGEGLTTQSAGKGVSVTGSATIDEIDIAGTTLKSSFSLATKGAVPVSLGTVAGVGTASLGAFNAPGATIAKSMTWGSTTLNAARIDAITVGAFAAGANLIIGGSTDPKASLKLTIGAIAAANFNIAVPITAMKVGSWSGGTFVGTGIGALTVGSGLAASISLSGSLGKAAIAGALGPAEWSIAGSLTSITAASAVSDFGLTVNGVVDKASFAGDFSGAITARAIGAFGAASGTGTTLVALGVATGTSTFTSGIINSIKFKGAVSAGYFSSANFIGAFSANQLARSRIYAGVTVPSDQVLPSAYAAFAADSEIKSVKIAGKGLPPSAAATDVDVIAARSIGVISLGRTTANSGIPNGIAAASLKSFSATTVPGGVKLSGKNLATQAAADAVIGTSVPSGDFALHILSPS